MAEQATRIADQDEGDYIATRDAYEQDTESHSRVVQMVEITARQLTTVLTIRGSGGAISSADGVNLLSLPTDLTDNLLTVGDKTVLIVMPEHTSSSGNVYITPIIFNSLDNVVGVRATKSSGIGSHAFRYGSGSGNYASPQLQWDIMGAEKIGLHITQIDAGSVVLKGGLI